MIAITLLLLAIVTSAAYWLVADNETEEKVMAVSVHEFKMKTITGAEKSLGDYHGQVLIIVNVASKCGFTKQYKGLQALYDKYRERGFVILGFPCNQFGSQEPGSAQEIQQFCQANFGVTFPLFEKIEVNGKNAAPLYRFLTQNAPGLITDAVKWNFTKFLIDKNGKPVSRFAPQTEPDKIAPEIEKLLEAK
jgi:glutathione peroxidase